MANIIQPKMFGQQPFGPFAEGLVFYWRGIPAGNVVDESLNRNHGTITGPTWVGDGLDFESSGTTYVDISKLRLATNKATLIIRAKVESTTGNMCFFGMRDGNYRFFFWWVTTPVLNLAYGNGTTWTSVNSNTYTPPVGEWVTYAITLNAGQGAFYANGISIGGMSSTDIQAVTNLNCYIGGRNLSGSLDLKFDGIISHVFLYNRAFSASEIAVLYLNPNLLMQQEPVWLFSPPPVVGVVPKGPLGHPFHGPFGGPVAA